MNGPVLIPPGYGYVLVDVVTIALVFLAALVQLATYLDKTIHETPAVDAARMLMAAGYSIIGVRWSVLFWNSGADLLISPMLLVGVALTALAQVVLAGNRLMNAGDTRTETGDAGPSE